MRDRKMMLFMLLVTLGAVATESSTESRQTLCGRELAKAHSFYCYGVEAFPAEAVTVSMPEITKYDDLVTIPKIPERFVYRARRTTEARLRTEALLQTCCHKPCQLTELLSHC